MRETPTGGPYVHGAAFARQAREDSQRESVEQAVGHPVSWEELHFQLIERLSPPSLVITRAHDVVHVSESAQRFLQMKAGHPTLNVLETIHPMLRVELRAALFRAEQTG